MAKLTLKHVRDDLRTLGMSIRHTDGEYRVYHRGTDPEGGIVTSDLAEAWLDGKLLAIEAPKSVADKR